MNLDLRTQFTIIKTIFNIFTKDRSSYLSSGSVIKTVVRPCYLYKVNAGKSVPLNWDDPHNVMYM